MDQETHKHVGEYTTEAMKSKALTQPPPLVSHPDAPPDAPELNNTGETARSTGKPKKKKKVVSFKEEQETPKQEDAPEPVKKPKPAAEKRL